MNTQFKKWDVNEESRLMDEVAEGLPIYAISKAHDRSKRAIELRLLDIAIRMLGDGCEFDEIYDKTKCTKDQINERIKQAQEEKKSKESIKQVCDNNSVLVQNNDINTIMRELNTIRAQINCLSNIIANLSLSLSDKVITQVSFRDLHDI